MIEPSRHTAADRINVAVFAVVLLVGAGLFAVSQRQAVSLTEKRRLAPVPEWSWRAVAAGRTGTALTDYYADHFEFRDRFIALADRIKAARGFSTGDYQIIATGTVRSPPRAPGRPAAPGPTAAADEDEDGDYANIRSVIVYKRRAVQISIGSTVTARVSPASSTPIIARSAAESRSTAWRFRSEAISIFRTRSTMG